MSVRRQLALAALMVAASVHVASFGGWVVEDAAISFAYARHLAEGHGLVPWIGGERVEGYSNPSWVALLALGQLVGLDPFLFVKVLAIGFTAATVPLVADLGARAAPSAPRAAALLAAAAFAVNPQVGIFGAAGLENPLVGFLLALAARDAAREVAGEVSPRWPPSALWWLLLSLSRPETIAYAALGGFVTMVGHLRAGRGLGPTLRWLALFFAPFGAYHAARYAYFGFPFPMTYYAKQGNPANLASLASPGWRYVRGWAVDTWYLGFLPTALAGLLAPGGAPTVRALMAGSAAVAAGFAVYTGGDWMEGYRWLTSAAVPLSVLLGAGAVAGAHLIAPARPRAPVRLAALVAVGVTVGGLRYSLTFADGKEIGPWQVRKRVVHATRLAALMHVDERPSVLTVDMGGYMWWSGFELYDIVGLTDVAFALAGHSQARLVEQYVFDEVRPTFVNLPGRSGAALRAHREFFERYVDANQIAVRRDLLFDPTWPGATAPLPGGLVAGLPLVASPEVAAGEPLLVEFGLKNPSALPVGARVVLDGPEGDALAAWDVELGYGFHPPPKWRGEDFFHGRYALRLPDDLAPGAYALRLRLSGPDGELLPDEGALVTMAAARVVPADQALAAAEADRDAAFAAATDGRCAEAEEAWRHARRHRLDHPEWAEARRSAVHRVLARCWVQAAGALAWPDRHAPLLRARKLDPSDPAVLEAARAAADELERMAEVSWANQQKRLTHRALRMAVELDPTRSHARRRAEMLRPIGGR